MEHLESRMGQMEKEVRTIKASSKEMETILKSQRSEIDDFAIIVMGGQVKVGEQIIKVDGLRQEVERLVAIQERHEKYFRYSGVAIIAALGGLLGVKGLWGYISKFL